MSAACYNVRRERGTQDIGWLLARFSFSFAGYVHPQGSRFGPLLALNEDVVQPGTGFPMHPHRDLEILMIPVAGAIAHEDSLGHRCEVRPGQALLMRAGSGIWHSQFNASAGEPDHHLQVWIEPAQKGLPPMAQLAGIGYPEAGHWQTLAGPRPAGAPLQLAQQAVVRRGLAGPRRPLRIALGPAEAAYLHVVGGTCELALPPGGVEPLSGGEAIAIESAAAPLQLVVGRGDSSCDVLLVTFPAALLGTGSAVFP